MNMGLAFTALLLLCSSSAEGLHGDRSRGLLQSSVLIVSSADGARAVFGNLEGGETIEFAFDVLQLNETLVVDKPGVTIRGVSGDSRPTVRCPKGAQALLIRASGVKVENIGFNGCKDVPGVVLVQAPKDKRSKERSVISVSFSGVQFLNNTVVFNHIALAPLSLQTGVNATITDCLFSDNMGASSGGIELLIGAMVVENSTFTNNTAVSSGGAIWCDGRRSNIKTSIEISNCHFEANKVTQDTAVSAPTRADNSGKPLELLEYFLFLFADGKGGAVGLQNMEDITIVNSTFRGNVATAGGGVAILSDSGMDGVSIQLIGCDFDGNKAAFVGEPGKFVKRHNDVLQGGSIFLFITDERLNIKMEGCTVTNSQAVYGGGMHAVLSDRSQVDVTNCTFEDNCASKAGGGFLLRNGRGVWFNSSVKHCTAETGGGVFLTNNADFIIAGCSISEIKVSNVHSEFIGNMAVTGGGIALIGSGPTFLQCPRFINNTATRNGGGVAILDSNPGISLWNFLFENNQAPRGGGLYSTASGRVVLQTSRQFLDIDQPSTFRSNLAIAGGGLFFNSRGLPSNSLKIQNTHFVGNEAVMLENFESDPRRDQAISILKNLTQQGVGQEGERSSQNREQDLLSSCGSGGGGAICIALERLPDVAIVDVHLVHIRIENNKAVVGGGIYAATAENGWQKASCEETLSISQIQCRSFRIETANITNNVAEWGGGMFASNPSSIFAKCDNSKNINALLVDNAMSLLDIWKEGRQLERCLVLIGNTVKEGNETSFGAQIASSSTALELVWPKDLTLMKQTSGKPLYFNESNPKQGVQLRIVDIFNQTVIRGSGNEAVVTLMSPSNGIRGHQVYKASKGIVNVNSTEVLGDHVEHSLIFSARHLGAVHATYIIRDCFPGEEEGQDFKECRACEPNKYSFIPKEQCRDCEANAFCEGGAALIPKPGYWHSTPFSPQFHQCLIPEACNFPGRETILNLFYSNRSVLNPSNEPVDEDTYRQCTPGYKGRLCGSCEDGFGHLVGGECVECQETNFMGLLIFLAAAWSALLISFEIFNSMSANKVFMKALDSNPDQQKKVEAGKPTSGQNSQQENFPGYVEAFENLTETVKIFVNYLQVTSLAITINLSWNRMVRTLLRIEELSAGLSNGSAFIPLDCSFKEKYDTPASVLAIWLRIIFSTMLLAFFLSVCLFVWVATRHFQSSRGMPMEDLSTLKTYTIIITIAVVFFAYNGVTEELMRTVNCVNIDGEEPDNPNQVFTVKAGGPVWAEDTELVCFQGQHTATGVAGILGLVFFSFGFVVFIIALLTINRSKIKDKQFLSRYGFLYRAYRTEYNTIYWEALVVLRKAFVGAVAVFAFPLGPNLQAMLALGILVLALSFHCQFRPYRDIKTKKCGGFMSEWAFMEMMGLNELETLSIMMSIITFYSGIIFNDSNTSEIGMASMATFVVVMNGGYFVLMVLRIWGGLHVALDEKIECLELAAKTGYHARMSWMSKIGILTKHYVRRVIKKLSGKEKSDGS